MPEDHSLLAVAWLALQPEEQTRTPHSSRPRRHRVRVRPLELVKPPEEAPAAPGMPCVGHISANVHETCVSAPPCRLGRDCLPPGAPAERRRAGAIHSFPNEITPTPAPRSTRTQSLPLPARINQSTGNANSTNGTFRVAAGNRGTCGRRPCGLGGLGTGVRVAEKMARASP